VFRPMLIAAVAALAPVAGAAELPACQITIHAVTPGGVVQEQPVVDAPRVTQVREVAPDTQSGLRRFVVALDEAGSKALAAHTAAHIGEPISVRCDGEVLSQPVIRDVMSSPVALLVDLPVGDPPSAGDLDAPREILAWVDLPRAVSVNDEVTLALTVLNARKQGAFQISAIDIGIGFLAGFDVIAITPAPQDRDQALGALALTIPVDVAPGGQWTLQIRLKPRRVGVFVGDIDIWAGDRFLTRVAQLQVR